MNSRLISSKWYNIIISKKQKSWSQDELAVQSGLHRAYIGQIERGEKNIGLKNLEKIANSLKVRIEKLLS
ncbi:MAG: helix-turn-helix transcriptional regulator [Deltaproteobacteria bacterium]|nr:helix-turn-helix transcriptional regulator [Deltaproteobacteria bacterium]